MEQATGDSSGHIPLRITRARLSLWGALAALVFCGEAFAQVPPTITGQAGPLSTPEDTALAITLSAVTVTDPDSSFPTGFTLTVQNGSNYTHAGNTITPAANFNGALSVPVTVNDGTSDSNVFNLSVTVTAVNDAP